MNKKTIFHMMPCALALFLNTGMAFAQTVGECDWKAAADNIAEPWEENTRTFSNGKTRLALIDTGEPAAAAVHLLILSPPYDEMSGVRQCRIVSLSEGLGFSQADFTGLRANYDPAIGLSFTLPANIYDPERDGGVPVSLRVTLNQATGSITARINRAGN